MIQTVEAVIDEAGRVILLGQFHVSGPRRAEEPAAVPDETALLSEAALADWNSPEEDAAWSYLQEEK